MKRRKRHEVAPLADLPPGTRKIVTVPTSGKGMQIGVFNVGGRFVAYRNICPHAGAPICEGRVGGQEGGILRCPWHGWEFDLLNGEHLVDENARLHAHSAANLEPFEVEIRDGVVWVLV